MPELDPRRFSALIAGYERGYHGPATGLYYLPEAMSAPSLTG